MSYFEQTKITKSDGTVINPSEDESIILLRRAVKLLESNAVVDANNRQRITLDALTAGVLSTGGTYCGSSTGINIPTAGAPIMGGNYWLQVWTGPVDQRWGMMDTARLTYDNGIRSHLAFS